MVKGEIKVGQLVCSKAGRDEDRHYLVLKIAANGVILIADGEVRRLDRPKRKNIKHLQVLGQIATDLTSRLIKGEQVTNAEIRDAISQMRRDTNT